MEQLDKIIKGCRKQRRKSQEQLYLRFADLAMNVSYRYARDLPEAEDILQNAFIKVFANIHRFNPQKGAFEAWLTRIVVNEALQCHRKNRRTLLSGEDHEAWQGRQEPEINEWIEAEALNNCLHRLPDGYRIVFNLYVVEEYSHKEIAELLGISESASRSQLARAKKQLRQLIQQQKEVDHAA